MRYQYSPLRLVLCALVVPSLVSVFSPMTVGADEPSAVQVNPFPLEDVRVLDGPFLNAQKRDAEYLLLLDPDRFLSGFRAEAGLEPKADKYGGWENAGVAGHSMGHYMVACSLMYASTDDERFREKVDYIVDELRICQEANGDGYVAAIPNGKRVFAEVRAGDIRSQGFDLNGSWVPWYTLHKLFDGLIHVHLYCENETALEVAEGLGDWAIDVTSGLDHELFQRMLDCEHGGMNETLVDLYALTGEEKYLELSRKFHHESILNPLTEGIDCLPGIHANTQFPKILGAARRYELTGDEDDLRLATFFWNTVVEHHTYATGGNSEHEHFGEPDQLSDRLSNRTTESCNTYNMLKLSRRLFTWTGDVKYADYYERALYNHILGSIHPESGMTTYFVPLKSGEQRSYSNPFDSFTCCHGSGMENHSKYGNSIYFHTDDELYVNLFIPSELTWEEKGIVLRQETSYPASETSRFTVSCEEDVEMTLKVRRPAWADMIVVRVNDGESVVITASENTQTGEIQDLLKRFPGDEVHLAMLSAASYIPIERVWEDGDTVEVYIPMKLRYEAMPDNSDRIALFYGPTLLAADLDATDVSELDDPSLPAAYDVEDSIPVLVTESRTPSDWIAASEGDVPLEFETHSVGRPHDVVLRPFYEIHDRPYIVFFDLFDDDAWAAREEAFRAERERIAALESRTIDVIRIGEMQPERDHNLEGENTSAGAHGGRKWRHATGGGWFAFELDVDPSKPLDLICTYWGGDGPGRTFDITIDDEALATVALNREHPDEFFDVAYPIPAEILEGKDRVTVRFQAHEGQIAGGLFGCRVIVRE